MAMGRARTRDKHLPARVVRQHGAFYFLEPCRDDQGRPRSRWRRLGTTEAEMWAAYAKLTLEPAPLATLGAVMDRYAREVVPTRSPLTGRDDLRGLKYLRAVFGDVAPAAVKPAHCYQYLAERKAKVRANRELAVLSSVFKFAIRLGLVDRNPTLGVERLRETPRERLPEQWEIAEFLSDAPLLLRAYVPLKLLTGLRQGDMLRLRKDAITDAGIVVREGKTGKRRIIEWSDELRTAMRTVQALQCPVSSFYVLSTRVRREGLAPGQPYTGDGFRSIWQRQMRKVMKAGRLQESFTEHDLRATTATEAGERAQELLDHDSEKTTNIYRRSKEPKRIKPLR